ncbi:MAG TPA: ATP-binding protein [Gemmatimonadaceae bacterium]|nr:ATP-binding protein [Gemmatimonadaceae bacterium]
MARLAQHRSLGSAPATEHAWLVAHGTFRRYAVGDVITAKGEQAKRLQVVLSGRYVLRTDRGAGSHKIMEWRAGDVGSVMPYSRGASPPNDVVVEEPMESLTIEKELFPEMISECPVITATLVHAMIDRARQFTSSDLRDEKLISLGKLASGLAHELNNPASAVVRSAKTLAESLGSSEEAARKLAAARLTDAQMASIDAIRTVCGGAQSPESLSAVARADREDAIADWLANHDVDESCAGPLVETNVTIGALDTLAANVSGDALDAAIRWLAAGCLTRSISSDIETAASRIYDLVAAVKGFSYMDRAPTAEPIDVRSGISDTLTMLGAKVRAKSVDVSLDLPDDLPAAHAVGAELNQVWMNLIDNAIDAVPVGGHIVVSGAPELNWVTVRIIDDGPGIPPEIQGRIFDPFFTTKGVGKGAGLGLDIVRRLLQRHEGEVSVESMPGRTEFQVRIPAEAHAASAAPHR